jgi:hypothetical protein
MKKSVGYVIAVAGLVVMVLGLGVFGEVNLFGLGSLYVSGAGIVLVVIGVVVSMTGGGGRRGNDKDRGKSEVPIYEGVGKKRRIVGYRKD